MVFNFSKKCKPCKKGNHNEHELFHIERDDEYYTKDDVCRCDICKDKIPYPPPSFYYDC